MIYHNIHEADYLASIKITAEFIADNGYTLKSQDKSSIGTGFFIRCDEEFFLVTARHVIGEAHLSPNKRKGKVLDKITLEVFQRNVNGYEPTILAFNSDQFYFVECESDNDLAITLIGYGDPNNSVLAFSFDDLATDAELGRWVPGEPVFLSGYPTIMPIEIEGYQDTSIPVLRQGVFSILPSKGYHSPGKLGTDYSLIDTFALGGFSGCPVICPEIGIATNEVNVISTKRHLPKKIVGMLVGRANVDEKDKPNYHAGLSYFVRSPSIIALIQAYPNSV